MDYIVSVLDFYFNAVDVFSVTVPEDEPDYDVYIQDTVSERGHHITDCHYMFTEAKKFKLNVEII